MRLCNSLAWLFWFSTRLARFVSKSSIACKLDLSFFTCCRCLSTSPSTISLADPLCKCTLQVENRVPSGSWTQTYRSLDCTSLTSMSGQEGPREVQPQPLQKPIKGRAEICFMRSFMIQMRPETLNKALPFSHQLLPPPVPGADYQAALRQF